jgi:predicted nucleic acid-binding Zn ribbon protein
MAKKTKPPEMSKRQQRRLRTQQIIFSVIAVLIILAMILPSLVQ